jgi:hypothetical protein
MWIETRELTVAFSRAASGNLRCSEKRQKENRNGIGGIFKKKRERRSHDDKRKEKSLFLGFLLSLGSPSEYGGGGWRNLYRRFPP